MATRKALQRKQQEKVGLQLERSLVKFRDVVDQATVQSKKDAAECEQLTSQLAAYADQGEPTQADFAALKRDLPRLVEEQSRVVERLGDSPVGQSVLLFTQWNRMILKVVQYEDERTRERELALLEFGQLALQLEAAGQLMKERVVALESECQELRELHQQCRICYEDRPLHVLVPCGHTACDHCAPQLRRCACCRAKIKSTCKLHL
jgi:phage-related minor tail protein